MWTWLPRASILIWESFVLFMKTPRLPVPCQRVPGISNFDSHICWPAFYVEESAGDQILSWISRMEEKDLLCIIQLAGAEGWLS